ncbi:MAG: hypothetical protein WC076_13485 [Terrimicrobiaceae bacterium]
MTIARQLPAPAFDRAATQALAGLCFSLLLLLAFLIPHSPFRISYFPDHDNETVTQNVYDLFGRVERQFLHGDTNKTFHLYYTGRDSFEVDPQGGAPHYFYDERGRTALSPRPRQQGK